MNNCVPGFIIPGKHQGRNTIGMAMSGEISNLFRWKTDNMTGTETESRKNRVIGLMLALAALTGVFLVEQALQPSYWVKSAVKALAFSVPVVVYAALSRISLGETISLRKLSGAKPLFLAMLLFLAGTMLLFLIFRTELDLAGIRQSLTQKENLTRENCLFVFGYIIICNSFLEEAFFRGFVFRLFHRKITGALISAALFSVYHIGIFITWFNPMIFLLCVSGLAGVGLFLQWLKEKYHTIAASYVVHASANISINVIGAMLIFGILE